MNGHAPAPPRDSKTIESTFTAEIAGAKALQPHTCAEAKRKLDKPPEEPNEKSVTSEVHPIAQGLLQTGGLNIDDSKPLAALVLPLTVTDSAPESATECAITQDVPHHGAVDTSNWAALVTRPDTTFPNMNGSKAIDSDQRATLGHAFLINGDTTPQFPKQREAAPSLFEGNHAAATCSNTEAFWPCSPVSCAFGDFESHHIPFPNYQTAAAFTYNHQYHPPDRAYRHAAQINPGSLQPADDTVADTPNNPPASAKGRHFIASFGLRTK